MTLPQAILTDRLPSETHRDLEAKRQARDKQTLIDWLDHSDPSSSLPADPQQPYDGFAGDLAGRVVPLFRETGMKRNELILLQIGRRRNPPAAHGVFAHRHARRLDSVARWPRSRRPGRGRLNRVQTEICRARRT